jgi:hypothetical protein
MSTYPIPESLSSTVNPAPAPRLEVQGEQTVKSLAQKVLERPVQQNKSKCWKCGKKVGLLPFECKCRYVFCLIHRNASTHGCDFDYKEEFKQQNKNNLPVIADKLTRI